MHRSKRIPKPIRSKGNFMLFSSYVMCSKCDYKTNNEKALHLHMRYSHSENMRALDKKEDRGFYCRVCSLSFSSIEYMLEHSKKVHR